MAECEKCHEMVFETFHISEGGGHLDVCRRCYEKSPSMHSHGGPGDE